MRLFQLLVSFIDPVVAAASTFMIGISLVILLLLHRMAGLGRVLHLSQAGPPQEARRNM